MRFCLLSFALTVQSAAAFVPQGSTRLPATFGVASKSLESLSAVSAKKKKNKVSDDGIISLINDAAEEASKMEVPNGEKNTNGESTPHFAKAEVEEAVAAVVKDDTPAEKEEETAESDAQHLYDEQKMKLAIEVALKA
jgi:hypothetical protein